MESAESNVFKQSPIDATEEIRLLVLPPSSSPSHTYTFKTTTLSSAPKYEVLSNAWGNNHNGKIIQINDQEILVNKQLAETLEGLRRPGRERYLWVGTLCINNSDQEERGKQIKLQGEILGRAEGFIVRDGRRDAAFGEGRVMGRL